jgi:hypothetical protein
VTGVEPSVRMREIAQAQSQHPGVRYLAGSAEDMRLEQAVAADPGAPAPADPAPLLMLERG